VVVEVEQVLPVLKVHLMVVEVQDQEELVEMV
jgi:hypothetical protein